MFNGFIDKIKEWISKMLPSNTVGKAVKVEPAISTEMKNAIEKWLNMYTNQASWLQDDKIKSLNIPAEIASEKARLATIEMEMNITQPDGKEVEGSRAEYLNKGIEDIRNKIRNELEFGVALGSLVIKPYIGYANEILFDYVHADNFYPIAFNASGRITQAIFLEIKQVGDIVFTRVEYHALEQKERKDEVTGEFTLKSNVIVRNKVFKKDSKYESYDKDNLGKEVNLDVLPEWSELVPEATMENVDKLLFGYFKMPQANTVDPSSPLGVSGYERAADLIEQADKQYSRMLWEFEGGELAIDIDINAVQTTKKLDSMSAKYRTAHDMPKLNDRLFRKNDYGDEATYEVFSPQLRDVSLINGLNMILMKIEDLCGLGRGTIAQVDAEARTATELNILKQRSFSTNQDIQKSLENCIDSVIDAINVYATLYNLAPEGEFEVSYDWDDSIIVNKGERWKQEFDEKLLLVAQGLMSKADFIAWYENIDIKEAEKKAAVLKAEQPSVTDILGGE